MRRSDLNAGDEASCTPMCCGSTPSTVYTAVQVQGQVADLTDLQRILQRSEQKLSNAQQQNMTVSLLCYACHAAVVCRLYPIIKCLASAAISSNIKPEICGSAEVGCLHCGKYADQIQ